MKLAICSVLKTDHAVSGPAGKSWDTDAGCQVGASEESNQVKEFFRYIILIQFLCHNMSAEWKGIDSDPFSRFCP